MDNPGMKLRQAGVQYPNIQGYEYCRLWIDKMHKKDFPIQPSLATVYSSVSISPINSLYS